MQTKGYPKAFKTSGVPTPAILAISMFTNAPKNTISPCECRQISLNVRSVRGTRWLRRMACTIKSVRACVMHGCDSGASVFRA